MRKILIISALIFTFLTLNSVLFPVNGQQVPGRLVTAFRTGDADIAAEFFNERFQLVLMGVDHRVSQSQAKEIIRDFFRKYPPTSFEIMFKGDKKDSYFAIGRLKSKSDTFRVNFFFKKVGSDNLLHLLEIEKDNEGTF